MHLKTNRERTLLVHTWNCKSDQSLNYYLVNLSDENRPVKIFLPFYNPHRFSRIVGCCNGLVCIRTYDDETVIWNPLIRKYKKLPSLPTVRALGLPPNFEYGFNFAFRYDQVNDDYRFWGLWNTLKVVIKSLQGPLKLRYTVWKRIVGQVYRTNGLTGRRIFLRGRFLWTVLCIGWLRMWLVEGTFSNSISPPRNSNCVGFWLNCIRLKLWKFWEDRSVFPHIDRTHNPLILTFGSWRTEVGVGFVLCRFSNTRRRLSRGGE
jgi:hypothetical protein